MNKNPNQPLRLWLLVGLLSYVLLPWYAIQDTAWYSVLPQVFGGPGTTDNGTVSTVGTPLMGYRAWTPYYSWSEKSAQGSKRGS